MKTKWLTIILLFSMLLILFGCSEEPEDDPWSMDVMIGRGGSNDDPAMQRLDYRIDVSYNGSNNVRIVDIIPLISGNTAATEESQQVIEKKPASMSIEGKLTIDTGQLTKEQIIEAGPSITGVMILWEENGQIHETTKNLKKE